MFPYHAIVLASDGNQMLSALFALVMSQLQHQRTNNENSRDINAELVLFALALGSIQSKEY